jgi:nucleotide-binding universal stress UspA family protein
MNKIKRILACIDFSEYSLMTMEYAFEVARNHQAQITVINVINQRDINGVEKVRHHFPGTLDIKEYIRDMKKERMAEIKAMIMNHFFADKSIVSIKIDTGIPFECILNAVETEAADLIVMANKGRGNVSKVLFGSAAEKVFRHSPVPVISVRNKSIFKRGNGNE